MSDRYDEDGFLLLPSLHRLYTYSEIQQCWIGKETIDHFSDRPGEVISARYLKETGYYFYGKWYSSEQAALDATAEYCDE